MSAPKQLSKAPIVEAVIDLVVSPPSDFDVNLLLEFGNKTADSYSKAKEVHRNTFQIVTGPSASSTLEDKIAGYVFHSKDGLYVAQLRPEEFIFSRLKPYSSWDEFSAEARKIWGYYTAIVTPISSVKRIAIRYINQLTLPLPAQFEDYLTASPHVPAEMPQTVSGFFSQVALEDFPNKTTTMVVQFTQPLTDPSSFTMILDISSFKQGDFELDENKIWGILQVLREAKNRAFFSSITDRARNLYE
jgi:uncharacterized protein (TIGR04255 family)